MYSRIKAFRLLIFVIVISLAASGSIAQKKKKHSPGKTSPSGNAVLWEPVDIERRDLFNGPGGDAMRPDLSKIEFVEQDKSGHNKKYKIKDGAGNIWVAKLGREAKPETAAVRILWGLGYKTEINYLVPSITIPGKGSFTNVRLEARPENVKRLDPWKWRDNPFVGTDQLQGLKIMMAFVTNWDLLDMQNKILNVKKLGPNELDYVISDLGATFGKLGSNNLPIFFRLGRKTGDPKAWSKAGFIKGVKNGHLQMAFKGKSRDLMKGITVGQGRWLATLLNRLSDEQIKSAFRAANYSQADIQTFTQAFKRRLNELDRFTGDTNLARK
ncbi:MAG: hypothetical protein ABI878_01825 [Acidobacteriota bacterium]